MAVFKCKMCGGSLEIAEGLSVATCAYCGTAQTLPKLSDEKIANLYDRANHFRRNNDYDKAMGIYEHILNEDNSDAEAYWSLVLCRYGVEYVEDPATKKRVPTVNRAQFTSVIADEDYKSALQYADAAQKFIYQKEAAAIDTIQKGILEISQTEEPFDVFICYKETDQNGRRTPDSVLATELYHELIREGYKVFFARITLEDKLGTAYEPYIFAALNSAKVMVALGTKPEYFNAVWVKNEWSRYLALIKKGAKKTLIPAYRDMDPYDLPEEFSNLQAQDMAKLGFMQDLIRGIKKIITADAPAVTVKEPVITGGATNTEPLLERAFMFLEDGDWASADEYCEKVLDLDPKCGKAYLGKLLAELKVSTQKKLINLTKPFNDNPLYSKIMRFGDEELKTTLQEYNDAIKNRIEQNRLETIYQARLTAMKTAETEFEYEAAAKEFEKILNYKDSAKLAAKCRELAKETVYQAGLTAMKTAETEFEYENAENEFEKILNYKDSAELAAKCRELAKETVYNEACRMAATETSKYADKISYLNKAIGNLNDIADYKDSKEKIEEFRAEKAAVNKMCKAAKKRKIIALLIAACAIITFVVIYNTIIIPYSIPYNKAVALMEAGSYKEAVEIFKDLGSYKDCKEKIDDIYNKAVALMEAGSYKEAAEIFTDLGSYKDCKEEIGYIYKKAVALTEKEKYFEAAGIFIEMPNYKDAAKLLRKINSTTVAAGGGNGHTVGLKANGSVVATGFDECGECDVEDWEDIVAVYAGGWHTVGLKANGSVVATGDNYYGQCDVEDWEDIVAVSAGYNHTIGLKADGSVVTTGDNEYGQCDVKKWTDIVAVSARDHHTVGLKADGSVVATGYNDDGECDVEDWTDIVAVSAGVNHTVGLNADGSVVATGLNDDGQCDVEDWKDIVALGAGDEHTVGLKADGSVVATGDNYFDQCDVEGWKNIQLPITAKK